VAGTGRARSGERKGKFLEIDWRKNSAKHCPRTKRTLTYNLERMEAPNTRHAPAHGQSFAQPAKALAFQ
jgi:hypothetical protein